MVVLCCIVVVTGFLPSPVSRSSLSSPPSQVSSSQPNPIESAQLLLQFASLALEIMNSSSCPHVTDLPLHITEPKQQYVALHLAIMSHVAFCGSLT